MNFKFKSLCFSLFSIYCFALNAQVPTNGLVGYWPFNGNANDESGYGNNGIVHGAKLTTDVYGVSNKAYEFDGIDDYIEINNENSLNPIMGITLCAWVRPVSFYAKGNSGIIDKGYYSHTNPYYQYHLGITGDQYPFSPSSFVFNLAINNNYESLTAEQKWFPNNWYFVVGTYDGVKMKVFVNGELQIERTITGSIDTYNEPIFIGATQNFPDNNVPGKIDDVGIYDRALSSEEIKEIYSSSSIISISGEKIVCQGQQNVTYSIQPINNASYTWNYTGTGVSSIGISESVNLNFSNSSTSGVLSVTVTGPTIPSQTAQFPIIVNPLPSNAGIIGGDQIVCRNQSMNYSIPIIANATYYSWEYSSSGTIINGNSENISIFFNENATSGNLSVTGFNDCGFGNKSMELFISVITCSEMPNKFNIPNAFSPNSDGINDFFVIDGIPKNSSLIIFNRVGKTVYTSDNYHNEWNGKDQNGNILDSDTYWYVLKIDGIPSDLKDSFI